LPVQFWPCRSFPLRITIFFNKTGGYSTMARMTQTAIVSTLADKTGLKKTEVKGVFDALTALATTEVKKNGEFTIPGFGKIVKAKRKAREGRNPATGETIKIPAKTTVKFRLGKSMKDAVS
jgi:DNA-binding protein HU-beta